MVKKETTPADAGAPSGGKSKLKLILSIMVGLLLVVGLSVDGAWLFLGESPKAERIEEVANEAVRSGKQPVFYEVLAPAFIVNFNQNGRQRYMQVGAALMGHGKAQIGALREHTPLACNKLVMLFSSQGFNSPVTSAGKEMFRQQATIRLWELAKKETGQPAIE